MVTQQTNHFFSMKRYNREQNISSKEKKLSKTGQARENFGICFVYFSAAITKVPLLEGKLDSI